MDFYQMKLEDSYTVILLILLRIVYFSPCVSKRLKLPINNYSWEFIDQMLSFALCSHFSLVVDWKSRHWHHCVQQTKATNYHAIHSTETFNMAQTHFHEDWDIRLSRCFTLLLWHLALFKLCKVKGHCHAIWQLKRSVSSHRLNSNTSHLVLLLKTIWRYWKCFLSPVAMDGIDGSGLKLEKNSSSDAACFKNPQEVYYG